MPTLASFLLDRSQLGSGSTVAELILNPQTCVTGFLDLGSVASAGAVGVGTIPSSGSINQGSVTSEGAINVGSIIPAGTIDPEV